GGGPPSKDDPVSSPGRPRVDLPVLDALHGQAAEGVERDVLREELVEDRAEEVGLALAAEVVLIEVDLDREAADRMAFDEAGGGCGGDALDPVQQQLLRVLGLPVDAGAEVV